MGTSLMSEKGVPGPGGLVMARLQFPMLSHLGNRRISQMDLEPEMETDWRSRLHRGSLLLHRGNLIPLSRKE